MVFTGMRTAFRPLVVLSLVIAMTGAALAECVTEDLTPEQKACCAAMGHDCGAVGVRPHSEAYLRLRTQPALTVWTSAQAATWERGTLHAPGSRVEHWPDTGHYLHEEHVERTVRLLEEWAPAGQGAQ